MRKRLEQAFDAAEAAGMRCVTCGAPMIRQGTALRCANGHTVNGNRKGYFHFLSRPTADTYNRALFEARRRVLEAGYYLPITEAIQTMLPECGAVLDVGCGDGYYVRQLRAARPDLRYAGVDISRDAIETAADGESLWCVADMRHLPFKDHTFTLVLDILSPADYLEFRRVLRPDGFLVKVTPGPSYLAEIREARGMSAGEASAADAYLGQHMHVLRTVQIHRTYPVSSGIWANFVRMTPMNQDLGSDEMDALCEKSAGSITIDLNVILACVR